jgi:hypothetical protein
LDGKGREEVPVDHIIYFTPVERAKPEPQIEKDGSIRLSFELNTDPPSNWQEFFKHATGWTTAFEPPEVSRNRIYVRLRDEAQIADAITNVDQRIAKANTDYESKVMPGLKAAQEKRDTENQESLRKLDAARKAIDEYEQRRPEVQGHD